MKIRSALFFLLLALVAAPAQAEQKVAAGLSDDFVAVNESFDGAHLMVFGLLKSSADVAIVVEGPPVEAQVRQKERHFGVWINGEPQVVSPAPSYYAVITSKPVTQIMSADTAKKYRIGTDALPFADQEGGPGVIVSQQARGLYIENERGVKILDNKLFRADIDMPGSVPMGTYKTYIYEFVNGQLVASRTEDMQVAQVGLGARISAMARHFPLSYGLASLLLSLVVGAASASFFKRGPKR